ncbi:MAG: hypothetical protein ACTSRG_00825 [Candidatus Helarchaeota archaeon]
MELFGVLPDLIPFMAIAIHDLLKGIRPRKFDSTEESIASIPKFFLPLYYTTHSFIPFGISFTIMFIFYNKLAFLLLPWALHIFFDIFTHSIPKDIMQTKFLYPLSNFSINGYSWQYRKALIINYALIGIGLVLRILNFNYYIYFGV